MDKLRCEICGGQIEIQPDRRGICMNCGTAYSMATMKEMFAGVKVSVTGSEEDVEQWRRLLDRYFSSGDFIEAERIVKKIMEAVPDDNEAIEKYDQLQVLKFMDIRNGVLKSYSGTASILTLPEIITAIDPEVFAKNEYLEEVFLPDGLAVLRHGLFQNCNRLRKVHIPGSVTTIEDNVFEYCGALCNVSIPNKVTYVGERAFGSCTSLQEIEIPSSVIRIGPLGRADEAYYLKSYSAGSFSLCSNLRKVIFHSGLKEIGRRAFYSTAIEEVILPEGLELIGTEAFGCCSRLRHLALPESYSTSNYNLPEGGRESHWHPTYPWHQCENLEVIEYSDRLSPSIFGGTKYYQYYKNVIEPQQIRLKRRNEGVCQYCGGYFGRFSGCCKRCGKPKDY